MKMHENKKVFFILVQVKFMFSATKVLHLVLFLMWEFLELGNGLLYSNLDQAQF